MHSTIVLIIGANRGLGKGLLKLYLAKPYHTIVAGVRNPHHSTSKALAKLPKAERTSLLIIEIESTVETDAADRMNQLTSQGINRIDILIANAGTAYIWPKVSEVRVEDMRKHIDVNVYGIIWLYQATLPLLKKAKSLIWVSLGMSAAYLTVRDIYYSMQLFPMIAFPNATYAPSKFVIHYLTKEIHNEEPQPTAFPLDPGWVQTDMGNRGAKAFGAEKAAMTIEQNVNGIIEVIDVATRDTHGGKLWRWDGKQIPLKELGIISAQAIL
ncbi:hypothetical protein OIDMADRAFT_107814 [Oidiodendron maius Zn]|uniref:NAD(P)-binding protein n=1 Tax=Oidiodendron maius (strain Zn) TaxID=913774 RepID=A0A0C3E2D9_OIDMZ|nr:hypothetical protein OIDMADRAFT_107814 [Oidiodendron maius Zn]